MAVPRQRDRVKRGDQARGGLGGGVGGGGALEKEDGTRAGSIRPLAQREKPGQVARGHS